MAMLSDDTIREVALNYLLKQNGKLDRAQLEKMAADEFVAMVRLEAPDLKLTAEMLKTTGDRLLDSLKIHSSAPYSKGSSDSAMLSSSS